MANQSPEKDCVRTTSEHQPEADFPVSGTHIGLAFNPTVYSVIANRLAQAQCGQKKRVPRAGRIRATVKCATT